MAVAREDDFFPVEAEDRAAERLLGCNSSEKRPVTEHWPAPKNRPRARSRSKSTDRDSSSDFGSRKKPRKFVSLWVFSLIVIGVAVMFLLGVCLGFYVRELQRDKPDYNKICGVTEDENKAVELKDKLGGYHESLVYYVRAEGIRDFVEAFGADDPTTGDDKEERLADAVFEDFQNYIIGSVTVEEYDVVVTSPDPVRPNELEVLHHNGSRLQHFVFESNVPPSNGSSQNSGRSKAKQGRKGSRGDDWKFPHVAFSPAGVAEGQLVYAHYGRETDFVVLRALGVELSGSIVMLRLGRMSVAEKIRNCEIYGAKAALLYWHDVDVTFDVQDGLNSSSFVPYASAVDQSIDNARVWQPYIPCQTISADQAQGLLTLTFDPLLVNSSDLVLAPAQWQGASQTPFAVGLRREKNNTDPTEHVVPPKLRVSVYNVPKKRTIQNVINTIQGTQEPDHYVLVGAPRTSLPGQPQDAVISTSILIQLSRAFRHVHQLHGWLPRRGVKLVSWGGAELSSLGMVEMIKKQHHLLGRRMVAYFDLRHLVAGNETILANIPASLNQLFNEIAFGVPDPKDREQTLHMTWIDSNTKNLPVGSYRGDPTHSPFLHILGIPTIHLQYLGPGGGVSPLSVTTRREQHHHFKFHLAMTRMLTFAMLSILDNRLMPFDLTHMAQSLHDTVWQTSQGLQECSQNVHKLGKALLQCERVTGSAQAFSTLTSHYLAQEDSTALRSLNDVAMLFDRLFIVRHRGWPQHILYPVLSDGSLAVLSELCQVGNIMGDWSLASQFQETLTKVLGEALISLNMGA